ncbi:sensor histidine kinase [Streptomyces sp. NRRL S-337]|uniref:sensor histidine kinase n=1 Tax=Streptomyces sp. NRRL S-337 TaxID=1463900 RepID=UPI000A4D7CC8|nr:ATP-binding protein [Streptomyces sp. NRRL S-337]
MTPSITPPRQPRAAERGSHTPHQSQSVQRNGRFRRAWATTAAVLLLAPALLAPPGAAPLAILAALTTVVSLLSWPIRRYELAHVAAGTALLSLAADLAYFGPPGLVVLWLPFETVALLVLLGRAVRQVPGSRVGLVGGLTGAAAVLLPLRFTLHAPHTGLKESIFVAALAFFPAACATGVGVYLRSLDTRRAHAVALARREQRLEVARDLHDFVAHEVTGIVLEAQAAQFTAPAPSPPTRTPTTNAPNPPHQHQHHPQQEWQDQQDQQEQHRALLERIEQAGLRALESMDRTVAALRTAESRERSDGKEGSAGSEPPSQREPTEPPPTRPHGLTDLPELVDRFSSMTPAEVTLELTELTELTGTDSLTREAEDTAYRVVLEALTNVRRHAPRADRVEVSVGRTADRTLKISVTNTAGRATSARSPRQGGGTGLAGLAERVSALGGTLEAGPHGNGKGWHVRCLLPTPPTR